MKFLRTVLLLAVFVIPPPPVTPAPGTPQEFFDKAELVFVVWIKNIEEVSTTEIRAKAVVRNQWKGKPEQEMLIVGDLFSSYPCFSSEWIKKSERWWLVYGRYGVKGDEKILETSACDGTKPLSEAANDLEFLKTKVVL